MKLLPCFLSFLLLHTLPASATLLGCGPFVRQQSVSNLSVTADNQDLFLGVHCELSHPLKSDYVHRWLPFKPSISIDYAPATTVSRSKTNAALNHSLMRLPLYRQGDIDWSLQYAYRYQQQRSELEESILWSGDNRRFDPRLNPGQQVVSERRSHALSLHWSLLNPDSALQGLTLSHQRQTLPVEAELETTTPASTDNILLAAQSHLTLLTLSGTSKRSHWRYPWQLNVGYGRLLDDRGDHIERFSDDNKVATLGINGGIRYMRALSRHWFWQAGAQLQWQMHHISSNNNDDANEQLNINNWSTLDWRTSFELFWQF